MRPRMPACNRGVAACWKTDGQDSDDQCIYSRYYISLYQSECVSPHLQHWHHFLRHFHMWNKWRSLERARNPAPPSLTAPDSSVPFQISRNKSFPRTRMTKRHGRASESEHELARLQKDWHGKPASWRGWFAWKSDPSSVTMCQKYATVAKPFACNLFYKLCSYDKTFKNKPE
jgi:hypothetical protein